MTRPIPIAAAALILAATGFAASAQTVSPEIVAQITAKLAEMNCQMDPADIEVDGTGYELDDVICEGGNQFDIALDADLNETGRRAE